MEEIMKAKKSNDPKELDELSNSFNYKVRRAVARNSNTSQETLKVLQRDPALNVAFMANLYALNKVIFDDLKSIENPCVLCENDESIFHEICPDCREDSYSRMMDGFLPYGKEKIKFSYN
jgi:hypothetical protein